MLRVNPVHIYKHSQKVLSKHRGVIVLYVIEVVLDRIFIFFHGPDVLIKFS